MASSTKLLRSPALLRNGQLVPIVHPWHSTQKEFLLHFDSGFYSVATTFNQRIFGFNTHLRRIVQGLYASSSSPIPDFQNSEQYKTTMDRLGDLFRKSIKVGAAQFLSEIPDSERNQIEMKIAFLVEKLNVPEETIQDLTEKAWVYISERHIKPKTSVEVQVRPLVRDTPELKSLEWIHKRSSAEEAIPEGVEECIISHGNELYEGLSSNFFAVKNGQVIIAPEGTVLTGSIMRIVMEVCSEQNIPLKRECPTMSDMQNWEGCFITSTSRLVLPVHRISWQLDQPRYLDIPISPLVSLIREQVQQRVFQSSEPIFE